MVRSLASYEIKLNAWIHHTHTHTLAMDKGAFTLLDHVAVQRFGKKVTANCNYNWTDFSTWYSLALHALMPFKILKLEH